MGQRLVVNIYGEDKETPLSNIYLHWSGFTNESLDITEGLLEMIKEENICLTGDIVRDKLKAFKLLKNIEDAKLVEEKCNFENQEDIELLEYLKKELDFKEKDDMIFERGANRSDGMICLTTKGIENNIDELEVRADIYLAKNIQDVRVSWDCLYICEDEDEYEDVLDEYKLNEDEVERIENINIESLLHGSVDFNTFKIIKNAIYDVDVFKNKDNIYYAISSD